MRRGNQRGDTGGWGGDPRETPGLQAHAAFLWSVTEFNLNPCPPACLPQLDTGRILVKFHSPGGDASAVAASAAQQTAALPGVRLAQRIEPARAPGSGGQVAAAGVASAAVGIDDPVWVFEVTDGTSAAAKAAEVRRLPGVRLAEPDGLTPVVAVPNDALYMVQWYMDRIQAEQAWDVTTGSRDLKVGWVAGGWLADCRACCWPERAAHSAALRCAVLCCAVPCSALCTTSLPAAPPKQVCVIDLGFRTTHQDLRPNFNTGWNR